MRKVEGFDPSMKLCEIAGFNAYGPREEVWPGTDRSAMAYPDYGQIQNQTVREVFNRSALIARFVDRDENGDCGAHHQTGCHFTGTCQTRYISMSCLHIEDNGNPVDFYRGVAHFLYGMGALSTDKRDVLRGYVSAHRTEFLDIDSDARHYRAGYQAVRAVQYPARQRIAPLVHEIHDAFKQWMEYNEIELPS